MEREWTRSEKTLVDYYIHSARGKKYTVELYTPDKPDPAAGDVDAIAKAKRKELRALVAAGARDRVPSPP